jgi:integrase/recombinase XerD
MYTMYLLQSFSHFLECTVVAVLLRSVCKEGSVVKVQRVRFEDTRLCSWIVLDDDYLPVRPILDFLKFLEVVRRSPYTVRASAYHLKLYWEFLRDERLDWRDVDVVHLAAFISWLRRPQTDVVSLEDHPARRTDATIDQILTAVHAFYAFHMRMKSVPDIPLYRLNLSPSRRYRSMLYGMVRSKSTQSRIVAIKREKRLVKTLTRDQVQRLLGACTNTRDRFLLTLLYETGMRIGQVLGLRHSDIKIEDGQIQIVPRVDNANGARAKTRDSYSIPVDAAPLQLYTDYLINDLNALEVDCLPDYVFINLWEGEIGNPMTYETVMSLIRRLRKKTGIPVTPHMFRHTRATEWIRDDKLPLTTVSQLLGHSNIQTTYDIYVHLTPEDLRKVKEAATHRREGEENVGDGKN